MPSTRGGARYEVDPEMYDSDEYDPSYHESSSGDEEIPLNMRQDRAQWVVDNAEAVEELFRAFKAAGTALFGRAFHQCGSATTFSYYVYKHTTPGCITSD